jgi:hypothetical protein
MRRRYRRVMMVEDSTKHDHAALCASIAFGASGASVLRERSSADRGYERLRLGPFQTRRVVPPDRYGRDETAYHPAFARRTLHAVTLLGESSRNGKSVSTGPTGRFSEATLDDMTAAGGLCVSRLQPAIGTPVGLDEVHPAQLREGV